MSFLTQGGSGARMNALTNADADAIRARSQTKARQTITKQYLSTLLLTALGGALAMGGFRILSQSLGHTEAPGVELWNILDIVVTTLVLGGGAQGIHDLISKLEGDG